MEPIPLHDRETQGTSWNTSRKQLEEFQWDLGSRDERAGFRQFGRGHPTRLLSLNAPQRWHLAKAGATRKGLLPEKVSWSHGAREWRLWVLYTDLLAEVWLNLSCSLRVVIKPRRASTWESGWIDSERQRNITNRAKRPRALCQTLVLKGPCSLEWTGWSRIWKGSGWE